MQTLVIAYSVPGKWSSNGSLLIKVFTTPLSVRRRSLVIMIKDLYVQTYIRLWCWCNETVFTKIRIDKQGETVPVENLDFIGNCSKVLGKNGKLLRNSFRAAFCVPSGVGKTNALLSLLFNKNGLRWTKWIYYDCLRFWYYWWVVSKGFW